MAIRVRFNDHGGCVVLGRSDATLNRFGVRIGSAEIYRTVDTFHEIADSLIVCVEDGKGGYYMPLFVKLVEGIDLTDSLVAQVRSRLRRSAVRATCRTKFGQFQKFRSRSPGRKWKFPVRPGFFWANLSRRSQAKTR